MSVYLVEWRERDGSWHMALAEVTSRPELYAEVLIAARPLAVTHLYEREVSGA
jgi:hypothetical protein